MTLVMDLASDAKRLPHSLDTAHLRRQLAWALARRPERAGTSLAWRRSQP